MDDSLSRLTIKGFKSIRELKDFELKKTEHIHWRQRSRQKQPDRILPPAEKDHGRQSQ